MKKIKLCLLAALMTICINAHAAGIQDYYAEKGSSSSEDFSANTEIQWLLTSVSIDGKDTGFNREELGESFNGNDIFSLNFNNITSVDSSGNLSGTGAPNRYFSSYTIGEKQSLKILPMRSTLMASIFEPKGLKEHDFYNYLQNTYKWDRIEKVLIIYSKIEDKEVVMTFFIND